MTRKGHLTAQIKPATRNAILDQLAGIADGIIEERIKRREYAERWRAGLSEADLYRRLMQTDKAQFNVIIHEAWAEIAALRRPLWRRLLGLR